MATTPVASLPSRYGSRRFEEEAHYRNGSDDLSIDDTTLPTNSYRHVTMSRQSTVSNSSRNSQLSQQQDLPESNSHVSPFSTTNVGPRKERHAVSMLNVQSRVPQSFEGYQTRGAEMMLIKDLLFIFQGIQGTNLKRLGPAKYDVISREFVNPCVRHQALRLCCLGTFYDVIKTFVAKPTTGIMMQSFKHGLNQELQEYYRIIALMHKVIGKPPAVDTPLTDEQLKADEPSLLTMTVWSWDVKKRFEFLANLVKRCEGLRGGELCSAIYPFCEHGCPVISTISKNLLSTLSKPLYTMICEWILYGELEDPFNEFFIQADHACRTENLWHSKYTMREKMLPDFLTRKLANRILATGKNINFLREICQWSVAYSGRNEIEKKLQANPAHCLFLQDDAVLRGCISKAYETTSSMVLTVLMEQSRLLDHLNALKKYLLLGQGDFIKYLLDMVQFELAKPASKVFHHNLSSILESTVRSTNAQFEDEEILSRLDIRMLQPAEKDVGWNVFCLDYKVQGPIGTVLSEEVMNQYNMLFNALWRIKRVEATLSALWKNQATLFKLQRVMPELGCVLHRSQLLISEMIHFVHQTQYYIMFEATECAWDQLKVDVAKSTDLDEVIEAHSQFLDTITTRSLLVDSSRNLLDMLRRIFTIVFTVNDFLTKFDHTVMVEYSRRISIQSSSKEQLREAQKSFFKNFISKAKGEIESHYTLYQDFVRKFLLELNRHPDLTLQCLSFRLDFNEYYQQNDARLSQPLLYQHRRMSMDTSFSILSASMEKSFTTGMQLIPEDP